MVRILANGEIVQDDDPRVQPRANRQVFFNLGRNTEHGPGWRQDNPGEERAEERAEERNEGRAPFSEINQHLVNMGFPRWNLGNQVVEPVMSIVLLLLIMMLGVRGLLLVGLIYVVSHLSQR